jgi:hypothetical protein
VATGQFRTLSYTFCVFVSACYLFGAPMRLDSRSQ